MTFSDNKRFWTEFIELYRDQRCLWDVKSREYSNKHLRKESLDVLVEKSKDIFPDADEKFVKTKIDSLRASFRREMKKMNSSKSTGRGLEEVYQPTLWYFNLLRFTTDQETARKWASSLQKRSTDDLAEEPEDVTEINDGNETENSPSLLDDCNITSPSERSSDIATNSELGRSLTPSAHLTSDTSSTCTRRQRKRKVVSEFEKKKELFLDTATNTLNRLNESTAFGSSVAFQIADLDSRQKIFAQKLISDVIYHGKLGNLSEYSVLQLNSSHPPYTNIPNVSNAQLNLQPTPHPFSGYNYQNTNYPPYQPYKQPPPSQSHASNNINVGLEGYRSHTATTGNLSTNDDGGDSDLGEYLMLNNRTNNH